MTRLALAAALLLAACGSSDDPFTADMKTICNASGDPSLPPDLQRMSAMKQIAAKVKTPEAARLLSSVIQAAPADRAALLEPALAKAKLSRCRFLE
jgi:hypothetical protein